MKQDEIKQISNGLSSIIDRLQSLSCDPINTFDTWPKIAATIKHAHDCFRLAIRCFIDSCEYYRDNLKSVPRPFFIWQGFLEVLWNCVDFLRAQHNRLFCNDYIDMIYHHILIEEMFASLPETFVNAKSEFLILPSGELIVWPLKEELTAQLEDVLIFNPNATVDFSGIGNSIPLACFECHREKNYERQYILSHEIFHIIVQQKQELKDMFEEIAQSTDGIDILGSGNQDSWISQFEELFCDFAGCWYFGPIYLQAFADEMLYYSSGGSQTHPSGALRAKFLLAINPDMKTHRGYKAVKNYFKLRDQGSTLPANGLLKKLGRKFIEKLETLGLSKFEFIDKTDIIAESFKKNIPFVVADVRTFINNLPPNNSENMIERYADLVSESLRKTSLLRQAKKYVREPGDLFAIPMALTKNIEGDRYK